MVSTNGVERHDWERIEEVEENERKYLGITEYKKMKEIEIK